MLYKERCWRQYLSFGLLLLNQVKFGLVHCCLSSSHVITISMPVSQRVYTCVCVCVCVCVRACVCVCLALMYTHAYIHHTNIPTEAPRMKTMEGISKRSCSSVISPLNLTQPMRVPNISQDCTMIFLTMNSLSMVLHQSLNACSQQIHLSISVSLCLAVSAASCLCSACLSLHPFLSLSARARVLGNICDFVCRQNPFY